MRTLNELNFRRELCLKVIAVLEATDDPREESAKAAAIAEYKRQLASLEAQIAEVQKPPPTVIGLKTAVINFSSDKE